MKKVNVEVGSGSPPHAVACEFPIDDVVSLTSVDNHSTLTVDIAIKDVQKVAKLLKSDVDFVEFTGSIMVGLRGELRAKWIKALENPIEGLGV